MAYYNGVASNYQELLSVLVNNCVTEGWSWSDSILSKNGCYIKLETILTGNAPGIRATGGTGKSGATLLNPAATSPRMGNPGTTAPTPVFPVTYHLFIFENEVYFKIKFSLNIFHYLAFGKSDLTLPSSGLWISATACNAGVISGNGITITPTSGGAGGGVNNSPVAPFWNPNSWSDGWSNAVMAHGFDNVIWSNGTNQAVFVNSLAPLNVRLPSAWSAESVLLPISIYVGRPSSKVSLACQFQNSRYVRIDNYEQEQILQIGNDRWMIFPFYKKNSTSRDGGGGIDHTGTFGWAIRYDGP